MTMIVQTGQSFPIGATIFPYGVNFSVYSKNSTGMDLLLFDRVDDAKPSRIIPLDPNANRTYHYWHVFVPNLRPGQLYAYRAHGPFVPSRGLRYDSEKILLDPYGRSVAIPERYDRILVRQPGDTTAIAMKSVIADLTEFDWRGDRHPRHPYSKTVIYEMHVAGFTKNPNSGVSPEKRGTYAGLIEKIPYLQSLGVTAVELLPVFQFDAQDCPPGRVNYWGYAPVSFFTPHRAYSSKQDAFGPLDEFREMVKSLHQANIEVILDVVFNHTAEGDERGPTYCFKGLENRAYYILEEGQSRYANYTGCGNTFNSNHTVVRRLILDSLRYWVREMHVDGFRFDLASIFSRDENGQPIENPPILWDIEADPVLAGTKLIAEAWDAAGLYQVGSFIGDSWTEWNGKFRDDIRAFLKGDEHTVQRLPARLMASPDLYGHKMRAAEQSINFITCHDGFTLNDLVSYNGKHNEANGENNNDGTNDNLSWNCGEEGPTNNPEVEKIRNRQVKNFLTLNMLSLGTPMLLMGDEVRHTQQGNNNVYCQDNAVSWFDWSLLEKHADILRFTQHLIAHRLHGVHDRNLDGLSLTERIDKTRIQWHGVKLNYPDWGDQSRALAFTVQSHHTGLLMHGMMNSYWEPLDFELPVLQYTRPNAVWRQWIDTFKDAPNDIVDFKTAPAITSGQYTVQARSIVMLLA